MRLSDQTLFLHMSPGLTPNPSLCSVTFAAPASSSPISELFYLKHYRVAKGTLGYLVEDTHFILSFLFFQPLFGFVVTLSALELRLALSPAVSF